MKNSYLITVFLLLLICVSGCGNMKDGLVIDEKYSDELYTDDIKHDKIEADITEDKDASDSLLSDAVSDNNSNVVKVFVCGHVKNPGVYELEGDARICDALIKAGGVLEDGRGEAVAQALPVTDGMTIYVPGLDEDYTPNGNTVYPESDEYSDNNGYDQSDGMYNINRMTKEEWQSLPGIGETKADAIVRYREEHGEFKSIEELMDIPGIKEGVFNKIKDKIKV